MNFVGISRKLFNIHKNFFRIQNKRMSTNNKIYDFAVIGGGSGGIACAKRAAGYGANVVIIEGSRWGGTCVNVGCVPKKVMFNASHVMEAIHDAKHFGINVEGVSVDWTTLKRSRDRYIQRLNGIYDSGLEKLNITRMKGMASFVGDKTLIVGDETIRAEKILVAVGGTPNKLPLPGAEYVIDSDGFFELETQPRKVAVLGAGYIAVELAGVFNGLGTDTTLFCRGDKVLRSFDPMLSDALVRTMSKNGPKLVPHSTAAEFRKEEDGTLTIMFTNGTSEGGFDCILTATGRSPLTPFLNLPAVNVATSETGYITVDDYQNTTNPSIFALGDVTGRVELTPMAIAAGRRLADRLFGNIPDAKADYDNVPTVVFSHPTIGTCGLSEPDARAKYGHEQIKIYTSDFVNLFYGPFFGGEAGDKPVSKYKIICVGKEERVVGLHLFGLGSDEVLQGFGVAMKMGATKADFDRCVAIHPTAAEELVTFAPWGLSGSAVDN